MTTLRCLLILSVIFAAGACRRTQTSPAGPVAAGPAPAGTAVPAPAWKLKDVDGQVVSSESFKGKVVVVDFWATWCGPCRTEIPGYIALQKKYASDGLVVIGISVDRDANAPQTVKNFMEKLGVNYPVVLADDEVQAAFGGTEYIPTTFIIDRDGNIREKKVGAVPVDVYEATLLKYLK
jgi:thiol-disulfide isomerase/thioredoxin